jgi:hypothetical protein
MASILARIFDTRRFAVFYDFGEMNRHVAVDIEDFTVDDETSEAAN